MGTQKDSEATRARLIEAAGRLFAEKGMNGVTVRDIAKEAETHLSALNYHFRTKEALYREVVLHACQTAVSTPEEQNALLQLEPGEALFILIKESIRQYAEQSPSNWRPAVINRETWEPSPVFDEVLRDYYKPEADFVASIIGRAVNQPPDSDPVRFAVVTLSGLLDTFGLYGHYIDAIAPGLMDNKSGDDRIAKKIAHIVIEAAKPSAGDCHDVSNLKKGRQ